jgi:L-alanine-DL-glutamate epimerase-like enolase superfamily enzyme
MRPVRSDVSSDLLFSGLPGGEVVSECNYLVRSARAKSAPRFGENRREDEALVSAPLFRVADIELYERPVRLRMPFRFGVVTLTDAPQCFVRVRLELPDGGTATGAAAEMMVPKWFDKNLALTNEENFEQLRLSLRLAAEAYRSDTKPRTAFAHFAAHYHAQIGAAGRRGLNALVANYGPAQIDRAVLDALCRMHGCSLYDFMRTNRAGIDPLLLGQDFGDLAAFDIGRFLAGRSPAPSIAARHTVGLVDVIAGHPNQVNDGLPESLEESIARYGHTYFKLKVGGDLKSDVARLVEIASALDRIPQPIFISLDGNEQYDNADAVTGLWRTMTETPALKRLVDSTIFIEQPIGRAHALEKDVSGLSAIRPVIIDESDDNLDSFPRAKALGYRGVSSKCCKGLYKSILNAARCALWNSQSEDPTYFMSGEDLTTQAGLSVQQDLALVNLIGLRHVERNGHQYVNGMSDLPVAEQDAFLAAHPDLYERSNGAVRLRISNGELAIASLAGPGFASGAYPDWKTLPRMA